MSLCKCGCGELAPVAPRTRRDRGWIKGQPISYRPGHFAIPIADRFWESVDAGAPDDCWPWLGFIEPQGYGRTSISHRNIGAHRVSYMLANGPIPDGQVVRHSCDNRACVNPAHLLVGTQGDNVRDAVARDRIAHGTRVWNAVLDESTVREIRRLRRAGWATAGIARHLGFNDQAVRDVVSGRTWRRVGDAA